MKEEIYTDEKDEYDFSPGALSLNILPKLKPCLACCVQLVPVVSSALSHQSQQPKALAKL